MSQPPPKPPPQSLDLLDSRVDPADALEARRIDAAKEVLTELIQLGKESLEQASKAQGFADEQHKRLVNAQLATLPVMDRQHRRRTWFTAVLSLAGVAAFVALVLLGQGAAAEKLLMLLVGLIGGGGGVAGVLYHRELRRRDELAGRQEPPQFG